MWNTKKCYYFSLLLFFSLTNLHAEGTKQLAPNATDRVFLYTNVTAYNNFGKYDGREDQRLYIHIANPSTEQVFIGFSHPVNNGHYPCSGSRQITGYFRIKDPTGRVVYPIRDNPNGQILDANTANINSYAKAVAGPTPIEGGAGYTPFVFDPVGLPSGDYYIEFSTASNAEVLNSTLAIEWLDITVATKSNNPEAIDGRLFSKNWALFAPSPTCGSNPTYSWFDRPFNGRFMVMTDENFVTEMNFNESGFQPAAFNVVYNESGTQNTNDILLDRKSVDNRNSTFAEHRIFLNDPDENVYPSGELSEFGVEPILLSCINGTACVEVTLSEPSQIEILIDLDRTSGNFNYDVGTADVLIVYQVSPNAGETAPYVRCIPWDGKDGLGNSLNGMIDISQIQLIVRYTQGTYHFPIYDAEFLLKGFDITTIRPIPNNGSPKKIYYNDIDIPDNYGPGLLPDRNPFNGCTVPCHGWTNRFFGDRNTINTWYFAREEYELKIKKESCPIAAMDDSTRIIVNTAADLDLLINDLGNEKMDSSSISIGKSAQFGSVNIDPTTFLANYTPNQNYIGQDSFTYFLCYNVQPLNHLCDSATVYITVDPLAEDCNNQLDEDGDGLIDCDDPDCQPTLPMIGRKSQGSLWFILLLMGGILYRRKE